MGWKWSEIKPNGGIWQRRNRFLSGGTKFNIFLVLCFLALVGWLSAVISRPYLRKARFQKLMGQYMQEYRYMQGEQELFKQLIEEAEKLGIPPLTPDNFEFQGGVGQDSTLRCSYSEFIKLPGNKYYRIDLTAEKSLFIPSRY